MGVLDDQAAVRLLAGVAVEALDIVVHHVQPGVGLAQPGKSQIAGEQVVHVVVLQQCLQGQFRRE